MFEYYERLRCSRQFPDPEWMQSQPLLSNRLHMWSRVLCLIASSAWFTQSGGSGCHPHVWLSLPRPACGSQVWKWTRASPASPANSWSSAAGLYWLQAMNHLQLIFISCLLQSGLQVRYLLPPL